VRKHLLTAISIACWVIPFTLTMGLFNVGRSVLPDLALYAVTPLAFGFLFILTAGGLSRLGLRSLINGRFKRDLTDREYFFRRVNAVPWAALYYFTPLYHLVLSLGLLRRFAFRLFGYQGNLDFTVYPDTWLRDLPVLSIGRQAYLSNKSSIATNICLMDGTILVEGITVGEKACVGHGTLIGPGTIMADGVELGANITSGIRVKYGVGAKVYEMCGIQHGANIGAGSVIEGGTIIGLRVKIGDGVRIREGSHIHTGTRIKDQAEADALFSEETGAMTRRRLQTGSRILAERFRDKVDDFSPENAPDLGKIRMSNRDRDE
jgi:carbonic anhydrase/acetyltransferase-like protein (isoleucine patch superfamily)